MGICSFFVLFSLSVLFSISNADYDICPGELRKSGGKRWTACMASDQCASDEVCVQSSTRYPGLWICARKPCRFHNDCMPGFYCHKKYDHPTITYAFKGICCEGQPQYFNN